MSSSTRWILFYAVSSCLPSALFAFDPPTGSGTVSVSAAGDGKTASAPVNYIVPASTGLPEVAVLSGGVSNQVTTSATSHYVPYQTVSDFTINSEYIRGPWLDYYFISIHLSFKQTDDSETGVGSVTYIYDEHHRQTELNGVVIPAGWTQKTLVVPLTNIFQIGIFSTWPMYQIVYPYEIRYTYIPWQDQPPIGPNNTSVVDWISSGGGGAAFYPNVGTLTSTSSGGYYESDPFVPLNAGIVYNTLKTSAWTYPSVLCPSQNAAAGYLFSPASAIATKLAYKLKLRSGYDRLVAWQVTFTPNGATAPTDYETLYWGSIGTATESPVYYIDPFDTDNPHRFGSTSGKYEVKLLPLDYSLAVDANRDGVIDVPHFVSTLIPIQGPDVTSLAKPFRFWVNDDFDFFKENNTSPNILSTPDCRQTVASALDVSKDFFPVFINIKSLVSALPPDSGVTYTLKQEDSALSFIYTNLTRDSAFLYKVGLNSVPYAGATIAPITATGVRLSDDFLNRIKNGDEGVLLMEGTAATTKPLVLVVEKGGVKIAEVSLDLSIGQDIVLLVHGMNSNVRTWDNFVNKVFSTSSSASDSIIRGQFTTSFAPDRNVGGVRCYRFQAGANENAGTARMGLENLTTANAMGQDPRDMSLKGYLSDPLVKCGDFETFDELGQELDDAVALLQTRHPNARIILVGHSRGGLSARAFLENPNYASEQAAVVGCLITSSPQQGSPMGRIWQYLDQADHRRHVYDANGQEVKTFIQSPFAPFVIVPMPLNYEDWGTVDFLMQTAAAGQPKAFLDIRRPVIMDMADNSAAVLQLNSSTQVASLPSTITFGEIVYQKANFGMLATGRAPDLNVTSAGPTSYSVFGFFDGGNVPDIMFAFLSTKTKNFLTNNRSPGDPALIGDGLIPAANQIYTTLPGFPQPTDPSKANKISTLVNQTHLSVHTDAPSRVDDLLPQLRKMGKGWFPQ